MWWNIADFIQPTQEGAHIESEWAVHQVATTVNFATQNKMWNWLFGGLNFQVEHHLFPRISHVHYPELNKRLKQVCAEFNVAYQEFPIVAQCIVVPLAPTAAGRYGVSR